MNGPDALRAQWAQAAQAPTSIHGLVAAVGGTGAAAGILGVTQRTVQRYLKFEREGKNENTRKMSASERNELSDIAGKDATRAAIDRVKAAGSMGVSASGDVNVYGAQYGDRYQGYREIEEELDPAELDDFFDALEDGDYDAAWDALQDELMDVYDVPGSDFADVEEFGLDIAD